MHFRELPTPALTIDLDILERNLDRMASLSRKYDVRLRPHIKTHKTPEVARRQIARGAIGLTVAKVGEAEVMAKAGFEDILIAFPVFGREILNRLTVLSRSRRVLVSLDDERTARELSDAVRQESTEVGVLVEFDAGYHRCGLATAAACVNLAQRIEKLPGIKLLGLMSFFGNIWGTEDDRRMEAKRVAERVQCVVEAFEKAGLPLEIVSGGSTPSVQFTPEIPQLSEIRPGTYVYNDLNTFHQGVCRLEDCAALVVTTVVSTAVSGRAIIDAGSKTLSSDSLNAGPRSGFGLVMEAPDAPLMKLNEEHGYLDITRSARTFRVGDVLTVVPNHVCTCVNMHNEVFLLRNEQVVGSWGITARGQIR